jgi:hypothetical protein
MMLLLASQVADWLFRLTVLFPTARAALIAARSVVAFPVHVIVNDVVCAASGANPANRIAIANALI